MGIMGCGGSVAKEVPYGIPMTEKNIVNTWRAGVTIGEGCWERRGHSGETVTNKLQAWTEVTFHEDRTCTATIVDCGNWERYQGSEWKKTPAEYVVVFRGSGTWYMWREGQKLKRGFTCRDDGVKIQFEKAFNAKGEAIPADTLDVLNDEKGHSGGNAFSFLRWSGGAGCSLTWFWKKHMIDYKTEGDWGTEGDGITWEEIPGTEGDMEQRVMGTSRQQLFPTEVDMENVDSDKYYGGCEYRGEYDSNSKWYYDGDYYANYRYPPRELGCEHVSAIWTRPLRIGLDGQAIVYGSDGQAVY